MEPPFGEPPASDSETLSRVEASGRGAEYFYQWYVYGAEVAWICANIYDPQSDLDASGRRNDAIIRGLLTRVVHTMRGVLHLTQDGQMSEVAAQLDRSITETSVLAMWLIKSDLVDRFERFLASSLKADLAFEEQVQAKVNAAGSSERIEQRILSSIAHYRRESGLTLDEIRSAKKLPDLRTMVELCLPADWYSIVQTSPSHITHPSWYDLRRHYLNPDANGELRPKWCDRSPHPGNYYGPCVLALIATRTHTDWYHKDAESRDYLLGRLDDDIESLMAANAALV